MLAAYHGHPQLVSLLLRRGADPDRLNLRGQSPLAGAVFKNEVEVVRVLVEEGGADPDKGEPSAREAVRVFGMEGGEIGGIITTNGKGREVGGGKG